MVTKKATKSDLEKIHAITNKFADGLADYENKRIENDDEKKS